MFGAHAVPGMCVQLVDLTAFAFGGGGRNHVWTWAPKLAVGRLPCELCCTRPGQTDPEDRGPRAAGLVATGCGNHGNQRKHMWKLHTVPRKLWKPWKFNKRKKIFFFFS